MLASSKTLLALLSSNLLVMLMAISKWLINSAGPLRLRQVSVALLGRLTKLVHIGVRVLPELGNLERKVGIHHTGAFVRMWRWLQGR